MSSSDQRKLTGRRVRTPRAAAIAGIAFALLLGTSYVLIRSAIPSDPGASEDWIGENSDSVNLALGLIPFAGIAFLWFIGVIRDRLGEFEDRFFATVFFGSGLLFLALVFVSAAIAASLLITYGVQGQQMVESGLYTFGREMMFRVTNTYAMRMAGVFMISVGTIWLRTRTTNRWLVILTYVAAIALLTTVSANPWVVMVFPAWVLVVSVHILFTNLRAGADTDTGAAMADLE